MSNFKNPNNIPAEIMALMPTGKDAPPSHASVDDGSYRGVVVGADPFRCRDPKNELKNRPRGAGQLDPDAGDRFWGL